MLNDVARQMMRLGINTLLKSTGLESFPAWLALRMVAGRLLVDHQSWVSVGLSCLCLTALGRSSRTAPLS